LSRLLLFRLHAIFCNRSLFSYPAETHAKIPSASIKLIILSYFLN